MGTDVRAYAMANMDVKRAACVGGGMCAHVCPGGALKLGVKPDCLKGGRDLLGQLSLGRDHSCSSPGRRAALAAAIAAA